MSSTSLSSRAGVLFTRIPNILKSSVLWNTALYSEPEGFEAGDPLTSEPFHFFGGRKLGRKRTDVLSRGDPFLWADNDRLYVFLEAEPEVGPGRIEGWVTDDLRKFASVGTVLSEPFHLSYPFVFEHKGRKFLMPESADGDGLYLYEFDPWPSRVRLVRRLLQGFFVDSSAIRVDGSWFLFTTTRRGLEIFTTPDLIGGELQPHPANPVTTDPRISRSGGGVFRTSRGLFRLAQDCSITYGANLNLVAIDELTATAYAERLVREHLYSCDQPWNRLGIHHQSYVRFRGRTIVALDGRRYDFYIHRARALALRALGR